VWSQSLLSIADRAAIDTADSGPYFSTLRFSQPDDRFFARIFMPTFKDVTAPSTGQAITISGGRLSVPDQPVIPVIEGDGTGRDIWRASVRVFDAAVEKAYKGKRKIAGMEVF